MHTKRLFIGIPLSPALQKRLHREEETWVEFPFFLTPPENLHVTLLFLGFVNEESVGEICESIEAAVKDVPAFEMRFERIHYTPSDETASMVWLTGEPAEELRLLRQNLEKELGYLVPERKSFRPHVNLARVRRNRFLALPEKPIVEKKISLVEPVSHIALLESISEEGKRRYAALSEFTLE